MKCIAWILMSLLALPACSALEATQDKSDSPLKVRKIVVYKHGVGYFERQGTVTDDQKITLSFKSEQMKDLLKSLFAIDLSGGRIATISYDTKDPLSKQLEDILIRVPDGNALTQFLTQLKGARVEVDGATGSVVGIEPVARQTKDGTTTAYKLVLYRNDGVIETRELLELREIKLLDEALRKDLQRMLDIYLKAKYADRKSVVLHATGKGERDVRVGYIVETPIWKTSYRLLFDEGGKPLLQGWAILENTTDEDWEDVEVSFVAGAPMSFIMDLYTAYYPKRPEIAVAVTAAPQPEAPSLAVEAEGRRARGYAGKKAEAFDRNEDAGEPAFAPGRSLAEAIESSMAPAAAGVEVGELFAYRSREKVSVKRGQAALVPILSERLDEGERVLFYRPRVASRPMNAYLFKNSTSLTLEAGPVTFFDGSTCIGEGLLRKVMKKGMSDILPYAIEAGVAVETKVDRRSDPVTRGTIADGVLTLTYTENLVTVYAIKNQLPKDVVLYLDHAKAGGYALAEPVKAEDDVDGHYRFRVGLKGNAEAEWKVRETMPVSTTVALLQTPAETIRYYASQRFLSEKARAFLNEIGTAQGEINRLRQEEQELASERQRLVEDEERARRNASILRDTPDELAMRKNFLKEIDAAETRLKEVQKAQKERSDRRAALERDLARKVREFREE
ncbi:MAG: DUF4139 domain-containing protein [Planctomycetes bacterium]|nr:DUF4139 domain-containing protein [Planctomycetota bacterium]